MSTKILPFLVPLLASALCSSKQYCDKDSCQPKCQNIRQISEKTPSILFKKARGRLGNQLNAYAMLLQLKKDYGYDTYLLQESYDILAKVFTKESIEIPVLEQSFCDISKLHIQVNKHGDQNKGKKLVKKSFYRYLTETLRRSRTTSHLILKARSTACFRLRNRQSLYPP